jgi:hypothetical protein
MRIAVGFLLLATALFAAPLQASALPSLADQGATARAHATGTVEQVRRRYATAPRKLSRAYRAKRRYDWTYYPYWRPYQYRYWQFYYPYGGPLF